MRVQWHGVLFLLSALAIASFSLPLHTASADERFFTYVYEAEVLGEGEKEFEQWITSRAGKEGGDYVAWDFREELEFGLTDKLTTALYLNFTSIYSSPEEDDEHEGLEVQADEHEEEEGLEDENKMEFEGISSEWKYQLLNPNLDAVGLVLYLEGTIGGEEAELEEKIILSKPIGDFVLALNGTIEQEWEFEHGETEEEAILEFTAGIAYKLNPQWSVGVEGRNHREYPDGLDLNGEEHSAWFVGPNVHYGAPNWWMTFTVLPQVHGNGEGESDGLQLEEHERVEVRAIVGFLF